jgi:hypothetical protein
MSKEVTNVLESPMTAKHLIISLGEKAFLALPKRGSLADGHCLILPVGPEQKQNAARALCPGHALSWALTRFWNLLGVSLPSNQGFPCIG